MLKHSGTLLLEGYGRDGKEHSAMGKQGGEKEIKGRKNETLKEKGEFSTEGGGGGKDFQRELSWGENGNS